MLYNEKNRLSKKEEWETQYKLELGNLTNELVKKGEEMKNEQSFDRKEKLAKEIWEIYKKIQTILQEWDTVKKFIKEIKETMGIKGE